MLGRTLKLRKRLWLIALVSAFACAGAAQSQEALIVALGASNTAGLGVAPEQAYPAQLSAMLQARGHPVQVLNAGVSGDTTAGMLGRLDAAVPEGTRLVLLQLGSNDERLGFDRIATAANFHGITHHLQARHIRFVRVDQTFAALPPSLHQADGLHLTPAGYKVVATRIFPLVLRYLQ